jgi:hypothetical protein
LICLPGPKVEFPAHAIGWYSRGIDILIHLALLHFYENRTSEALYFLEESLQSASLEEFIQIFLDQGEPMQSLLRLYKAKRDVENQDNQSGGIELIDYVDEPTLAFETKS